MYRYIYMNAIQTVPSETIAAEVAEQLSEDLDKIKPSSIIELIIEHSPEILTALYHLFIILLIIIISHKTIRIVNTLMDKALKSMKVDRGISKFLISTFRFFAYGLVIFIVAERLGINSASIIAVIGSAGLAIGLALQGSLSNVAGGIIILLTKPFTVGDYIISNNVEGTVKIIDIVYTTLVTTDNKKVSIPNASLSNGVIVNSTAYTERMIKIEIAISFSSDLLRAKDLMKEIYEKHDKIIKSESEERKIFTYLDSYRDAALVVGARGWCKTEDFLETRWDLQESIKLEFDKHNIDVPHNKMDIFINQ